VNKKTQKVMFSSAFGGWTTPKWLFEKLDAEFHFTTDVGASQDNRLCEDYLGLDNGRDALSSQWGSRNFCNPPYGRGMDKWIEKGFEESQKGRLVVFLIPARTDTRWFHEYILGRAEIRFLRGRIKFGDGKNSAPFPSMVVIFNGA
jgi:phage N-6-adenine-methyltransferase